MFEINIEHKLVPSLELYGNNVDEEMGGTILPEDYISNTEGSQEVSPFPAGDHKAARNRQGSIITKITTRIHKRSTGLERSEKNITDLTVPTSPLVLLWIETHRCSHVNS